MALAAQPANTVHAPDILAAVTAGQPPPTEPVGETSWEAEGGRRCRFFTICGSNVWL
jgi:hypothetical protein